MKILYSGYNGFGQWPTADQFISHFTSLNLETYLPAHSNTEAFNISMDWAYNVVKTDSSVTLKGFYNGDTYKSESLLHPEGIQFTGFATNDRFILFYNHNDKFVWRFNLHKEMEPQWTKLPNFIDAEVNIDDNNKIISVINESIYKIVSGAKINVAVTSEGRLFNIPSLIPSRHCLGKVIDVCCGYEHAILLTDQGHVYTWGGGSRCQLGHGSTESLDEPQLIEGLSGIQIIKISAGGWHCCAISAYGDLYTWGWNERGQLGICPQQKNIVDDTGDSNVQDYSDTSDSYDMFNDQLDDKYNHLKRSAINENTPLDRSLGDQETLMDITDNNSSCENYTLNSCSHIVSPKKLQSSPENTILSDRLINYAIPMLVDIYDSSNSLVLELNIVDVSCGSKHTVIKLDDGTIWGSGCNKYGQLGFSTDTIPKVNSFKLLNVNAKMAQIKCGSWTTVLIDTLE